MGSGMRFRPIVFVFLPALALVLVLWCFLYFRPGKHAGEAPAATPAVSSNPPAATAPATNSGPTNVYAHNLLLRKGPQFQVYVRWLRGQITPTKRNINPSFDDPESFYLNIKTGVLRTNIGDLSAFLNDSGGSGLPLKNIKLSGDGDQIKLSGTLHKVVPLPIEMSGTISAAPQGRILVHVTKLNVLKIPVKGVLGSFHVEISDLFQPKGIAGIQVSGNDILLDPQQLMPPPHIRGELTQVRIVNPDIEEVFGDAKQDVERVEQWRNFLRLRDGTIDFGKITMHNVDLIMIDVSNDAWFDLDLVHYQTQLVNGYSRMTPQAGLQIFMPDLRQVPKNKANQNISVEWLKNRNVAPPPEVLPKQAGPGAR